MTTPLDSERKRAGAARNQAGYAILGVVFLGTLLLLAAMTASLNVFTQGRREREQETIWRGNQYVRAIRLYYQKNGKFPQSLDDLTKQETGQPRFIRQAYKDPMNKQDGSWRLIYVTPNGQLIGSVMNTSLQGAAGVAAGTNLFGQPNAAQTGNAQQNQNQPQDQTPGATAASGTPAGANTNTSAAAAPGAPESQDQSDSSNPIIGGNIIGVASKVKKPSLLVYQKGTSYYQWEFIWNPLQGKAGAALSAPGGTQQPGTVQPPSPPAGPQGNPGTQPNAPPQIINQPPGSQNQ